MKYKNIVEGSFISRPNRFIAQVDINGIVHTVHVKNTGRCKELLTPNAKVFLEESTNPNRKTKYDLVSVYKGSRLINMDSQAPNKVFYEYLSTGDLFEKINLIKPEYKYKSSRIDFYAEINNQKYLFEVKGVTLEENNIVMFPDAPTERGVKHIKELISSKQDDYIPYIVFVIQMSDVSYFTPNTKTHEEFAQILREAEKAGVNILALDCIVTKDTLDINKNVKIIL